MVSVIYNHHWQVERPVRGRENLKQSKLWNLKSDKSDMWQTKEKNWYIFGIVNDVNNMPWSLQLADLKPIWCDILVSAFHDNHQNKWGNVYWKNDIHPSSRVPEMCTRLCEDAFYLSCIYQFALICFTSCEHPSTVSTGSTFTWGIKSARLK